MEDVIAEFIGVYWPKKGRMKFEIRVGRKNVWNFFAKRFTGFFDNSYNVVVENLEKGTGYITRNRVTPDEHRGISLVDYSDTKDYKKIRLPEPLLQLIRENEDYFKAKGVPSPEIDSSLLEIIIENIKMKKR